MQCNSQNIRLTNSSLAKSSIVAECFNNYLPKNKKKVSTRNYLNSIFFILITLWFVLFYLLLQLNEEKSFRLWSSECNLRKLAQQENEINNKSQNIQGNNKKSCEESEFGDQNSCKNDETKDESDENLISFFSKEFQTMIDCSMEGDDIMLCRIRRDNSQLSNSQRNNHHSSDNMENDPKSSNDTCNETQSDNDTTKCDPCHYALGDFYFPF
ncbi:Plasmodium exported protein, unknown function [Plasmodium relictum]|uniref:Transmembrane protein n=1 Tax=Plasmodium relictum TaxID=85471 RepID=A0A1J1GNT9_PLARL|nr:Plasmodium exported protein, unknown function [Plasmodium relictum]CRG84704.1 Plasmodium exported protein, unknown function [Plasmodium relictum]